MLSVVYLRLFLLIKLVFAVTQPFHVLVDILLTIKLLVLDILHGKHAFVVYDRLV